MSEALLQLGRTEGVGWSTTDERLKVTPEYAMKNVYAQHEAKQLKLLYMARSPKPMGGTVNDSIRP